MCFFVVLFYMKDSSSKSNYPLGGYIVVVFFTLVYRWCEVVQNADRRICQAHIVPQLLSVNKLQFRNGFAFQANVVPYIKVHKVVMFEQDFVELDIEMKFAFMRYVSLVK